MKKNNLLIPAGIAAIMMVIGYVIGYSGTLLGNLLTGAGLFLLGVILLAAALKKKADIKSDILVFLICGAMLIIGGKDLIGAALDFAKGPQEVHLTECSVQSQQRIGSLFGLYELNGTNEEGKTCHYSIDKETFQEYISVDTITVDLIVWEYSDVVKEIR